MQNEEKNNGTVLVAGGVIIAVSALGIYYIYSKNAEINEYLALAKDYEIEYKEFGADGEIDEDEQAILENKVRVMNTLEEKIKSKGFIIDLIGALAKLGIIVIAYKVTTSVLKYVMKRWPPRPPDFICPACGDNLYTDDRLKRHIEQEHPVANPDAGTDAWTLLQHLPQWLIDLIGVVGEFSATLQANITKAWDSIPRETQIVLIIAILVAVALLIAFSCGFLSPELAPIAAACVVCL